MWFIVFLWNIKIMTSKIFNGMDSEKYMPCFLSILLLGILAPFLAISSNFNHYTLEMCYMSLIVRYYINEPYSNVLLWLLLLSPLFMMSGLFVCPIIFVHLLFQYITGKKIKKIIEVVFTGIGALVIMGTIYLYFYKPIQRAGILDFWEKHIIHNDFSNFIDILNATKDQIIDSFSKYTFFPPIGEHTVISTCFDLIILFCFVVGLIFTYQHMRKLCFIFISSLLFSVLLSWKLSFPFGFIRTNYAYFWVVLYIFFLGASYCVLKLSGYLKLNKIAVATALIILLFPIKLIPDFNDSDAAFAMGIEKDLFAIADSSHKNNLILSYHFMSKYYTNYYLNNYYPSEGKFYQIVPESHADHNGRENRKEIYDNVNNLVSKYENIDAIWCIMPFAMGPKDHARACKITLPYYKTFYKKRGKRSVIIGWTNGRKKMSSMR
jgi:hypothetical protein